MHIARAPDDISERPTNGPALRAWLDPVASSQPVTTLATRRPAMAAAAIHGSAGDA